MSGNVRLWAIEESRGINQVVWDAPSAPAILREAERMGYKVLGPFVLEPQAVAFVKAGGGEWSVVARDARPARHRSPSLPETR